MNILVAVDSFKGSATSVEVASYIEKGIQGYKKDVSVNKLPIADGGEGTVEALLTSMGGQYHYKRVKDPLGRTIEAKYGILNNNIAVIEMAESSGLTLLKKEEQNPLYTTTFGTGELLKDALDKNVDEIIIGIGGSGTNDLGVGMAQALGASFKDEFDNEVGYGAVELEKIKSIDISKIDNRILNMKVTVLSDVDNPLCGKNGASFVFGPQKGADIETVKRMDEILFNLSEIIKSNIGIEIKEINGSGAAGGLGGGLIAFCNAEMESGSSKILELVNIEQLLSGIDLVITGEGKIDYQSIYGKAPITVAKKAKKYGIPVIAIVGSEGEKSEVVYNHGIDLIIDIINEPMSLNDAMKNSKELIESAGEKVIRAFYINDSQYNMQKGEIV